VWCSIVMDLCQHVTEAEHEKHGSASDVACIVLMLAVTEVEAAKLEACGAAP
jgi:hypothetical protein